MVRSVPSWSRIPVTRANPRLRPTFGSPRPHQRFSIGRSRILCPSDAPYSHAHSLHPEISKFHTLPHALCSQHASILPRRSCVALFVPQKARPESHPVSRRSRTFLSALRIFCYRERSVVKRARACQTGCQRHRRVAEPATGGSCR